MSKGITPVIATILLLLVAVAIIGFSFTFFSKITANTQQIVEQQTQQMAASVNMIFSIDGVYNGTVYVRNTGTNPLANLTFYVNDASVSYTGPALLEPGSTGAYVIDPASCSFGLVRIKVVGGYFSSVVKLTVPNPYDMQLQGVDRNIVNITNTGAAELSGFSFTVNGVWLNHSGPPSLGAGANGTFYLNDSIIAMQPDPAMLGIRATCLGIQQNVCFYCPYYAGYWKFNEGLGTTAYDSSTYGNNGTFIGNATWASGFNGTAFTTNTTGIAAGYVRVPGTPSIRPTNSLTISLWAKRNDSGANQMIISYSNWNSYIFYTNASDPYFSLINKTSGELRDVTFGYVSPDVWHHLTGTWNGTTMRTYLDGQMVDSQTFAGTISYGGTCQYLHMGAYLASYCTPSSVKDFNGTIDEVKILPFARSMTTT